MKTRHSRLTTSNPIMDEIVSISEYQARIHTALLAQLPSAQESPTHLHQAMQYAVLNGGKRLRPLLVYATGETLKADLAKLDVLACAVELVHAYSLVHDDLPAMDDDDFRRGKPACHKAFDEATAILAGDALQTLAFTSIAHAPKSLLSDNQRLSAIEVLARAIGSRGMAGGQALDLLAAGKTLSLEEIETIYRMKTGALMHGSIMMGIIAASIGQKSTPAIALQSYADHVSLAFQIQDDILDVEGNMDTLGKIPGSDDRHAKPTYVAIAGIDAAKKRVHTLKQQALAVLDSLPMHAPALRHITEKMLGSNT